jgi:outer membrane protein assembly factor BamB
MPNAQFINPNFIRRRFGMPPGFQAIQMLRAQAAGGGNPAGAAIAGAGAGPDASGPADVETIDQVVVAGDRVIASTSIGRIMAIDLADGGIAWQTRLADRAASNLVANDDFTCLRILTDTSCQLVVIDTYSGTLLARKSFAIDQGNMPLNIALAADGTLVWTQPDRICIKDLYEKGLDPTRQSPASADNMPIFVGATRADQLLVSNGTIAVVADNGQFIHLYSLETGLLRHNTDNGQDVECRLATNASDWNVSLLAVGQRLYGYSPKTLVSYNIDHPDGSPILKDQDGANYNFEAAFPGQDYLIMIDQPLQRITEGNKALPYAMVQAFSRTTRLDANGIAQESGVRGFADKIADPAGITAWQAVDGGLAYVSGDQKLHWLRGAREMANVAQ